MNDTKHRYNFRTTRCGLKRADIGRSIPAAVGRNRNGAADSQTMAVEGAAGSAPLGEVMKNGWIPRPEGIIFKRGQGRRSLPRRWFPGAETGCPEQSRTVL